MLQLITHFWFYNKYPEEQLRHDVAVQLEHEESQGAHNLFKEYVLFGQVETHFPSFKLYGSLQDKHTLELHVAH